MPEPVTLAVAFPELLVIVPMATVGALVGMFKLIVYLSDDVPLPLIVPLAVLPQFTDVILTVEEKTGIAPVAPVGPVGPVGPKSRKAPVRT